MRPIFESVYPVFYEYAKKRLKIVKELGDFFIIRKAGKNLRLHFAIDDFIDWWDYDIEPKVLESWLKEEVYTKAIFKWLPENSKFKQALENLPLKPDKVYEGKVYYLNLEEINDEDKLLKNITKNRRRDLKNMINRLNKAGSWNMFSADINDIWDEMIRFINLRFPNSPFKDKVFSETVKNALSSLKKGVWALRLNNQNIAYSIVLEDKGIAYWYLKAFNPEFSYFSPAKILLYKMILHYQKIGFKEFNFMKGESQYKEWWAKDYKKIYRCEYLNPSILKRAISIFISGINLV
ncbi:MAG: GNAT family N-acetyltransferase [candidate division WOR-3 bacterium]